MPNSPPTRKVKVRIDLMNKATGQRLADRTIDVDVPINTSNQAIPYDTAFIMAVERAKERLHDEVIAMHHTIIT